MRGGEHDPEEGWDAGQAIALSALTIVMVAATACDRRTAVTQPIAFNHRIHAVDAGLECAFCHEGAETAAHAGVPPTETCMVCHEDTMAAAAGEDCESCHEVAAADTTDLQKLQRQAVRGEPVAWRRIYDLPDHVYFSHRRHVTVAGIACAQCHGDVPTLTMPAAEPLVDHEMDWCTGCHAASGASNDCIHCHR